VPHQVEWLQAFESEKRRLESALGAAALKIEHVGSTAVPGLKAKPIIDIAIAVESFDPVGTWPQVLADQDYASFGDRYGWMNHFFAKGPETLRTFYLHMVEEKGQRWRDYLLFRDRLRASPGLRQEYESLKLAAAELRTTRDAYTAAKEDFIIRVLGRQ
jgi:GrpB-like predicted nucleotidyltransferase (UPF0157 family)